MHKFFVAAALVLCISTLSAGPKTVQVKTDLGEFPVYATLPEFVKAAIAAIPSKIVPSEMGKLSTRISVVANADAFAKAQNLTEFSPVMSNMLTKQIYIIMDYNRKTDPADKLSWVTRAEQSWLSARRGLVADQGFDCILAAFIAHELDHLGSSNADETSPNSMALNLLHGYAKEGRVPVDVVQSYERLISSDKQ